MRLLIKILASVVGFFGISFAMGGILFLCMVASGFLDRRLHGSDTGIVTFFLASAAITSVLGYLFLRQAWKHLRRPDRSSANHVVGIAGFLIGTQLFYFISQQSFFPKSGGAGDPQVELAIGLAVLLASYLLYRFALKPLAARAFPADDTPAPTLASDSTP